MRSEHSAAMACTDFISALNSKKRLLLLITYILKEPSWFYGMTTRGMGVD